MAGNWPKNQAEGDRWGRAVTARLVKTEEEMDTLFAHLRAIVAQGQADSSWDGWIGALEMLIPDSPPRMAELEERLRGHGMEALAENLHHLRGGTL